MIQLVNLSKSFETSAGEVEALKNVTLTINDEFIELEGINEGITLNSEIREAYHAETLMNEHMDGEFPRFKPGNNLISWTGDVSSLVIQPNWRYLV